MPTRFIATDFITTRFMTTTRLLLSCLLALLTLGVAVAENRIDLVRPDAPELAAHGDYAVGVRTLTATNPDQLDIAGTPQGEAIPRYDRELTMELWYPADLGGQEGRGEYRVFTRDGATEVTLVGRAVRDAEADPSGAPYPLIIISHGYPGNRFLLSHLAENLAGKGYVVAAIDHRDSTYNDQTVFGSTLLNRPLDQIFVLDELGRLSQEDGVLAGLLDAENAGIVGYSMGGYGALNVIGGGFTEASSSFGFAPPEGALGQRAAGSPDYAGGDPRVKAAIAIGPWGMNTGFWDAEGLSGVTTPLMIMAGSKDDVSGFENGVRAIFENVVNAERYLLVFENARHNAAAPIPAPQEVWGTGTFDHYADPVWDTLRMNNITQHFATAFFGLHLKGDEEMADYLDLVERAEDGVWSVDEGGEATEEHSHWLGFPERSALGLSLLRGEPEGE